MNLKSDPKRAGFADATGIYIRAQRPDGTWDAIDIAELDKESLLTFLRRDGDRNPLAENVVGVLLDHGNLHTTEPA